MTAAVALSVLLCSSSGPTLRGSPAPVPPERVERLERVAALWAGAVVMGAALGVSLTSWAVLEARR